MQQAHHQRQSKPTPNHSIAHTTPSAGIALPSVAPFQRKSSPARNIPVVQRALIKKEEVLIDKLKAAIVKGIASSSKAQKEDDDYSDFVGKLLAAKLIEQELIDNFSGTQIKYLADEKDKGLSEITVDNLSRHNLIADGVNLLYGPGSWDAFSTKIESDNTALGFGGKTSGNTPANVVTNIKWDKVHPEAKQGQGVTALILGSDHTLGSTPGEDVKTHVRKLDKIVAKGAYVAGHLLNDHLGGPGNDNRNIAAIPKDVNSEQSEKVEETVKSRVNQAHEIVFYQVKVAYDQDKIIDDEKSSVKKKKSAAKLIHYANLLVSKFGTYKAGTDFKKLNFGIDPAPFLKDIQVHQLPIKPPSAYKKGKKEDEIGSGYDIHPKDDTKYAGGESRAPVKVKEDPDAPAVLSVNDLDELILKDRKQVKLEVIAYSIYSLKINELVADIEKVNAALKKSKQEQTANEEELLKVAKEKKALQQEVKEEETKSKKLGQLQKEGEQELEKVRREHSDLTATNEKTEKKLAISEQKLGINELELNAASVKIEELQKEGKLKDSQLATLAKAFNTVLLEKEEDEDTKDIEALAKDVTSKWKEAKQQLEASEIMISQLKEKIKALEIQLQESNKSKRELAGELGGTLGRLNIPINTLSLPLTPISDKVLKTRWSQSQQRPDAIDLSAIQEENSFLKGKTAALELSREAYKYGKELGKAGKKITEEEAITGFITEHPLQEKNETFKKGYIEGFLIQYIKGLEQGSKKEIKEPKPLFTHV